jgi:ATP-dependent DNA helicase RecG
MRPPALFPLFAPVTSLKGVGPRVAPFVERAAGPLVRDLLFLSPHSLIRRPPATLSEARDGEIYTFRLTIAGHERPPRPKTPWKTRAFDETGFVTLVFFQENGSHLEQAHPPGAVRLVSGRIEADRFAGGRQIVHPDYMLASERTGEIPPVEPIYPATAGITSRTLRRFAAEALKRVPDLAEWDDPAFLKRQGWPSWREAVERLHAPSDEADLDVLAQHRRRLAFDELLAHQLALAQRRRARRRQPAPGVAASDLAERIQATLPFALTGAQARAVRDIRADLASGERMNRLLQGDVGSGKTVVALLAMADAAAAGLQSALMAPTEILARQHFETLSGPLAAQGVLSVLLTGRDKGAGRREKLAQIADGRAAVVVGTHALFQADIGFSSLALTTIDEQHRFGVSERARLQAKAAGAHLLAMSATPIPRTLELTLYGDLDSSRLDEKPPGRAPVTTRAAPIPRLEEVMVRLAKALEAGAQAFWICPLVSESEASDLAAAEARAASLRARLGESVGLIHGRLPAAEKDRVMSDFVDGRVKLLVATTVVEVGVDVPSATIMVIEQAERFGLAQLHQLRGRVGRGRGESSCVLLYDPPLSEIATRRLDILRRTDDGFAIAEMDLELRGGGDPLGLAQSGFPAFRIAEPFADRDLILAAADDARLIMGRDPSFSSERGAALQTLQALFDWRAGLDISQAG